MLLIMCALIGGGALAGWVIGVNFNLIIQFITIVGGMMFLNSWHVRSKELGSIAYLIPFLAYVCGLAVADIAYVLKYGFVSDTPILNSILPTFWKMISL